MRYTHSLINYVYSVREWSHGALGSKSPTTFRALDVSLLAGPSRRGVGARHPPGQYVGLGGKCMFFGYHSY